jgi:hypothetical protein
MSGDGSSRTLMILFLGGGVLFVVLPLLLMLGPTMRYIADYAPMLIMLSSWGFWTVLQNDAIRPGRRRVIVIAAFALVSTSIAVGILLAITGDYNYFEKYNPLLLEQIGNLLSFGPGK